MKKENFKNLTDAEQELVSGTFQYHYKKAGLNKSVSHFTRLFNLCNPVIELDIENKRCKVAPESKDIVQVCFTNYLND